GNLSIKFEQLKQKLAQEGLFEASRKKALPAYPQRIGIVTSPTGAALQDISNILKRRFPVIALNYPALVQGNEAPKMIIAGIDYFNEIEKVDVIIITRGGGSQEDLFCFNDEDLARAIARSRVPIISAVGHEIDFTIADFVADLRAPTPSAAAEIVVPDKIDMMRHLESIGRRMTLEARSKINDAQKLLYENQTELRKYHPERILQSYQQRFDIAEMRLDNTTKTIQKIRMVFDAYTEKFSAKFYTGMLTSLHIDSKKLDQAEQKLAHHIEVHLNKAHNTVDSKAIILHEQSPERILAKGYAILQKGGKIVSSKHEIQSGDKLHIRIKDGEVTANAIGTE
ncbi:MAG: exodeoxyribonuclease VII large subunit, partial [Candidatus Cloacimonadaceae bacterium]|nr:exodeoxyribonuclease VII large subunit [Candidatus Cloacimonadaceae bacterium]